jgi:hypothetical protein
MPSTTFLIAAEAGSRAIKLSKSPARFSGAGVGRRAHFGPRGRRDNGLSGTKLFDLVTAVQLRAIAAHSNGSQDG